MKKALAVGLFLLILGGCTAETTSYYLEYHKWVPISQQDNSSLKNQKKEVKVPSQK